MKPVRPLVVALLLFNTLASADTVSVKEGKLSAEFSDSELAGALAAVGEETSIQFVVYPSVTGTVSAQIDELPIEVALKRLLKGYNYAVIFDPDAIPKKINKVVVMGSAQAVQPPVTAATPAEAEGQDAEEPLSDGFVMAERNVSGQFIAAGEINGKPVSFLVDTGANMVTLSSALARRLGINMQERVTVGTANGTASGFQVVLPTVSVGGMVRENVQAVVLPRLSGEVEALLGMSFLQGLNIVQQDDQMMISESAEPEVTEVPVAQ